MADKGWHRKFEEPIPLPDLRNLVTLRDAAWQPSLQHFWGKRRLHRMAQRKNQLSLDRDRLFQKMSEVISLREKVAQAELAARALRADPNQRDEVARPEKEN